MQGIKYVMSANDFQTALDNALAEILARPNGKITMMTQFDTDTWSSAMLLYEYDATVTPKTPDFDTTDFSS